MSRVWRDPLSRLDLTAATQQPAAAAPSAGAAGGQSPLARTNKHTDKHPGMTIRPTLCEHDATDVAKTTRLSSPRYTGEESK